MSERPFISAVERDEARCRLGLVSSGLGARGRFLFRSFRGVELGESLPAGIVEVDEEDPKVMIEPSRDGVGGYRGLWFSDDDIPLERCRQFS